jgi:nitrite reductase/ring-hydroxylating ferredoxin subunit
MRPRPGTRRRRPIATGSHVHGTALRPVVLIRLAGNRRCALRAVKSRNSRQVKHGGLRTAPTIRPGVKKRKELRPEMADGHAGLPGQRIARDDPSPKNKFMVERNGEEGRASEATGWIEVGSSAELPPGATLTLTVGDVDLTLLNADGRVVALGGACLRCSRPLATASYAGGLLTCPGCGWKYDLQRGCVDGLCELRIEMHDVRVDAGRLLLSTAVAAPVAPS